MHAVDKSDLKARHATQEIDGLARDERRRDDWGETEAIEGIGDLGIQAGGGKKACVEDAAAVEERLALRAKWAVNEPAHDDRGIDNESRGGRWRHLFPAARVARLDEFLDRIGESRRIDPTLAYTIVDGSDMGADPAHFFRRERAGHALKRGGGMCDVSMSSSFLQYTMDATPCLKDNKGERCALYNGAR